MCQKDDDGRRTEVETRLFRHSLDSLDVIYAHRLTASFLSTRFPDGVVNDRSYSDRGCVCTRTHEAGAVTARPPPPPSCLCHSEE